MLGFLLIFGFWFLIASFCYFSNLKTTELISFFDTRLSVSEKKAFEPFRRLDAKTSLLEKSFGIIVLGPLRTILFCLFAGCNLFIAKILSYFVNSQTSLSIYKTILKNGTAILLRAMRIDVVCYSFREDQTSHKMVKQRLQTKDVHCSGMMVANHVSANDIIALTSVLAPAFVSKENVKSLPIISPFAQSLNCIFVSRHSRNHKAKSDIQNWLQEFGKSEPMFIFPEGTTSNGNGILSFATGGAFDCETVQPIVLHWKGDGGFHPAYEIMRFYYWLACQMAATRAWELEVVFLPPQHKNGRSPQEFCRHVRQVMMKHHTSLLTEEGQGPNVWNYDDIIKESPELPKHPFQRKLELVKKHN